MEMGKFQSEMVKITLVTQTLDEEFHHLGEPGEELVLLTIKRSHFRMFGPLSGYLQDAYLWRRPEARTCCRGYTSNLIWEPFQILQELERELGRWVNRQTDGRMDVSVCCVTFGSREGSPSSASLSPVSLIK
ncbi:hypothetical protein XENOCAPTIV_017814 [Xenoophorus captivus]|uniref:Uncharacterized protein n=1 Tax=Xenoophorus captivus TaxID=1517983 RepID=A0ABV0R9Q7_9TELE